LVSLFLEHSGKHFRGFDAVLFVAAAVFMAAGTLTLVKLQKS
jgi:hypothetical protein